jgi:hypothetical protein
MRMTQAEVDAYQMRHRKKDESDYVSKVGCDKESELHAQIFDECRRRGWIALHGAMSERTHRTDGEADFSIMASGGRRFDIECKTRTGKLSPAQLAHHHHAKTLGHTIHVVRSFEEFLKLI